MEFEMATVRLTGAKVGETAREERACLDLVLRKEVPLED